MILAARGVAVEAGMGLSFCEQAAGAGLAGTTPRTQGCPSRPCRRIPKLL